VFDGSNLGIGVTPSALSLSAYKELEIGSIGNGLLSGTNDFISKTNAYYNSGWKYATSGYQASLYEQNAGQHIWQIASSGTANNAISFITAMTLDNSGNLLVGTTSASVNNSNSIVLGTPTAANLYVNHLNGVSSGYSYATFGYNGSQIGSIAQSGTTAVAYNTSSDYRLKENVQNMTGALAKVSQLRPVTYDWIVDKSQGQGFIAHELQAIVPDCVTGTKDAVDKDGKPVYQGVDTSFLVATLTAAIQELNTLVTEQAAEITALKAKVGA
jgi:hypothetical protein